MVWIENKNTIIEEKKVNIDFSKRKSQAKTFKGELIGDLIKARNDNNFEMEEYIREKLMSFNKFYPSQIIRVDILQGYKDYKKAVPDIWKDIKNNVLIRVWNKGKYRDEEIKKEDINNMLRILRRIKIGEEVTCYWIAKEMGYGKTEKEAWQNLWKLRMSDYFPKYYRVNLFLDKINIIEYGQRGKIKRLR